MSVVRVNWTMMAMRGDNWELLKDYESEGDCEDSPMSLLTSDEEQGDYEPGQRRRPALPRATSKLLSRPC